MMKPMTQMANIKVIPWGRPHESKIFAKGILLKPPIIFDMILVAAVKECSLNALVTYGLRERMTTSWMDVTK
jgi:hypothetical protein